MIGNRLKQIRKEKKLSQRALANILSTSSGYISEIEQGKTVPGGNFFVSLNRALGVSIDWLLTGEGEKYIKDIITVWPKGALEDDVGQENDPLYNKEGANNVMPIDPDMGMAMEIVAEVEEEQGVTISSPQREELIKLIYKEARKHRAEERADAKSKYRGLVDSFKNKKD